MLGTLSGVVTISIIFLVIFVRMYRQQLEQERAQASSEVNQLLQVTLENAMIKRDLEGLGDIVRRLGAQANIDDVMILDPRGEVRFASRREYVARRFDEVGGAACEACELDGVTAAYTRFVTNARGQEVLRSVNPVRNRERCVMCHGPLEENPVNGVLLVDYGAAAIRHQARQTTLLLMGSGSFVTMIMVIGGWWFMRRFVLSPVDRLAQASRSLSRGELDTRIDVRGGDELAQLADCFNDMAENLQRNVQIIKNKEVFSQRLIDGIPDGIRVIDADFRIVRANQAYCDQMGQTLEEVINAKCYESSHGRRQPCPATMATCPLHELERSSEPLKCIHQHVCKDGRDLIVEVGAAPIEVPPDDGGRLIVESIRDLGKDIDFSHEQRLATLSQLGAGVAHEIHNPLASIRLALGSTLRAAENGEQDATRLLKYLGKVDQEIDKCLEVTDRLLKLSMPGGGHALVSLNDAVNDTVSLLAYEASQHGIEVDLELASPEVRVLAADSDIRMVVMNMVQNAFHGLADGGRLVIETRSLAGEAQMIFEDSGVGIRPDDLHRVFDPFFSRRGDGVSGTGLGLPICKSIVEHYAGRIEMNSRFGEGTRFTVVLPGVD